MKKSELTEKDVIHIRNKKEAKGIATLLNESGKLCFHNTPYTTKWLHDTERFYLKVSTGKLLQPEYLRNQYNIIPASKFLKPSLKKRVKELEKEFSTFKTAFGALQELKLPKTANNIEVHFDEVEKLPEKWCVFVNEQELVDYANKYGVYKGSYNSTKKHYYHFPPADNNSVTTSRNIEEGYTEISFETFKRLVLKEDEKPVEFETGKWYKDEHSKALLCLSAKGEENSGYGFDVGGEWMEPCYMDFHGLVPATDEEVKEALMTFTAKEYKGKKAKCLHGCLEFNSDERYSFTWDGKCLRYSCDYGIGCLFENGKWAEIVSEPEAIDFSKAGQLVISNDGKILVYTTDESPESEHHFSGTVVESKIYTKGHTCNHWLINQFILYTEPVTLSN